MSNEQLYFAIGLPCLTIIVSLIVSLLGIGGLREAVKDIREDIREVRGDLKNVVAKLGAMDVELGKIMDKTK